MLMYALKKKVNKKTGPHGGRKQIRPEIISPTYSLTRIKKPKQTAPHASAL